MAQSLSVGMVWHLSAGRFLTVVARSFNCRTGSGRIESPRERGPNRSYRINPAAQITRITGSISKGILPITSGGNLAPKHARENREKIVSPRPEEFIALWLDIVRVAVCRLLFASSHQGLFGWHRARCAQSLYSPLQRPDTSSSFSTLSS